MEPVSLAASIITLISAASATGSALTRLWGMRNRPEHLHAAINDVTDFKAMLQLIRTTVDSAGDRLEDDVKAEIERLLSRAKSQLDDYRVFLEDLLKEPNIDSSEKPALRRRAKVRELFGENQRRIESLRQNLASLKASLGVVLGATNLRYMPMLFMSIQQISLMHSGSAPISSTSAVNTRETAAVFENIASSQSSTTPNAPSISYGHELSMRRTTTQYDQIGGKVADSYVMIQTKSLQRSCPRRCPCQCHICVSSQTPRWLRGLIGAMFFKSTGTPLLNHRSCNASNCSKAGDPSSIHFQYLFPTWLLPIAIEVTGSWRDLRGCGATWSLKIPRTIKSNYICNRLDYHIQYLSSLELRQYMERYKISAIDLTARGATLFERAVYWARADICSLLLEDGVNLHFQRIHSSGTLGQYLWTKALKDTHYPLKDIKDMLHLDEYLEDMSFNALHRAVLNMSSTDLTKQIKLDPQLVHGTDIFGFTPLHWAIYTNQANALDLFLNAGANINAKCKNGIPILHYTAFHGSSLYFQKLVDAGADVRSKDEDGNSVLIAAMFRLDPDLDIIRLLLQLGVDTEDREVEFQRTALMVATQYGMDKLIEVLLDYGAGIETTDICGDSPIFHAIWNNNPSIVRLLCERGAALNRRNKYGWSIIHYALRFGSIDVMRALAEARICGLNMDPVDIEDYWDMFYYSRPYHYKGVRSKIEVEEAEFEALLDSVTPCDNTDTMCYSDILEVPGSFPKDPDKSEGSSDSLVSETDDYEETEFHDAFEELEDIEATHISVE